MRSSTMMPRFENGSSLQKIHVAADTRRNEHGAAGHEPAVLELHALDPGATDDLFDLGAQHEIQPLGLQQLA